MNHTDTKRALANPATRAVALDDVGRWVIATVLLFGGEPATAYRCAAAMVEGLVRSYEDDKEPQ